LRSHEPHTLRGYLLIAASGLCWGVSASLGRAVFTGKLIGGASHPIDPLIIAQSRTTISFLLLAPILLARRGLGAFRMAGRDVIATLALGVVGMAGSNYFYYLAIQKTTVATAIILQYTAPMMVLFYMIARGQQRATLRRVGSVFLAVFGIALTIGIFGSARFRLNAVGAIAAELAAVAFACYNVAGASLLRRYDRWRVLAIAFLAASVFWQFINPAWKIVAAHYSGTQGLFLLAFALVSVLLPFSLYFGGLQYLDATRAIVTSCLEPVFTIGIAAAMLGETLGPFQVAGIIVVLLATVMVQLPEPEAQERDVVFYEPME
jgi:drug/metabolite transporter (DMT)-like permease